MPVQTLLAAGFTERYTDYCLRRFGDVVTLRILGVGEFVSIADPEGIREIFTGDPEILRAGEANASIGIADASIIVADGQRHLRLRRLLLPPFHGEAVRRHEETIRGIAATEAGRWPVGRPVGLHSRMQAITLEIILRAVVGVRDESRARRLRAVLPGVLAVSLFALFAEHAHPRVFNSRPAARLPWLRARAEAKQLLDEEIAEHRAHPDGREDVLALLMQARDEDGRALPDAELRDQLLTLLIAGHETTATALAWCFERLVRHPDVFARLRADLAREDGGTYLDAVVKETLRVRPVLDQVMRRLARPMTLAGHDLPAGTLIAASIIGVQRSHHFEDPQRFWPDRFLDRPAAPYTLIPFGGGTRRCLGASFAMLEMRTVLRAVLEQVDLAPATARSERASRGRRFTTVPGRGARVVVTRRAPGGPPGTTVAAARRAVARP